MQVKLIARALQKERQAQAPVTAEVLEGQPADNDNDLRHLLCDRDEAELVLWTKYHNQLGKPVGFVEVEYEVLAIIYARQQYNVAVSASKRDGALPQPRAALKAIETKSISRQWFRDFCARPWVPGLEAEMQYQTRRANFYEEKYTERCSKQGPRYSSAYEPGPRKATWGWQFFWACGPDPLEPLAASISLAGNQGLNGAASAAGVACCGGPVAAWRCPEHAHALWAGRRWGGHRAAGLKE